MTLPKTDVLQEATFILRLWPSGMAVTEEGGDKEAGEEDELGEKNQ